MNTNRRAFLKLAAAATVAPMLPATPKPAVVMGHGFGEPALSDALALHHAADMAMAEMRDQMCAAFGVPYDMVFGERINAQFKWKAFARGQADVNALIAAIS